MPADGLAYDIVPVGAAPNFQVTLPEPISAPEVFYLLFSLATENPTASTLERPAKRFGDESILASLHDGHHSVLTAVPASTVDAFTETREAHLIGHASKTPTDVLQHLLLYADANNFGRPSDDLTVEVLPSP